MHFCCYSPVITVIPEHVFRLLVLQYYVILANQNLTVLYAPLFLLV